MKLKNENKINCTAEDKEMLRAIAESHNRTMVGQIRYWMQKELAEMKANRSKVKEG